VLHRLLGSLIRGHLRREGSRLAGALEPLLPRTRPGERRTTDVGDRDDRVVEGLLDMSHTRLNVLFDLILYSLLLEGHLIVPARVSFENVS
jgi:hypothetical protein